MASSSPRTTRSPSATNAAAARTGLGRTAAARKDSAAGRTLPTELVSGSRRIASPKRRARQSTVPASTWPSEDGDNAVRVRKAGELVAERFRREIARGTLAIGHQLPREEELTATFGVARTTLREALRVLEYQGLLTIKRGRGGGGIITMPRLDSIAQSFALMLQLRKTTLGDVDDARLMIEPPLAGRLAAKHTDEDLDALRSIVDRAHDAADTKDRDRFGAAAAALHEAVIERGGNNTMAVMGVMLHDLVDRHIRAAAIRSSEEDMLRAVRSYRRLLALIEKGDSSGATAHWHRQLVYLQQARANVQLLDIYED